jgi:hypothetical protein
MSDSIDECIRRLIDIAEIKREYVYEMIEDSSLDNKRDKKRVMSLDEQFLSCLEELKDEAEIESIAELDATRYPRVRDLKALVEELLGMEDILSKKGLNGRKLVIR